MRVTFKGSEVADQRIFQGSGSLQVGMDYLVLEIFAQADGANKFALCSRMLSFHRSSTQGCSRFLRIEFHRLGASPEIRVDP